MLRAALVLALVSPCTAAPAPSTDDAGPGAVPWPVVAEGWRTDPVWYDGQAEKCTYEATRSIYGEGRAYVATAYTNKQLMDPATTTKAAGSEGVEVFKHHWSERVPTERYDYDFSTASFVRTADLAPFKLTAATQEDCGASFKQLWREGSELRWFESVYFPDAGIRRGELEGEVQLTDALSLVLRDLPFATATPEDRFGLRLVPSQRSTRQVPFEPADHFVRVVGTEELELPAGRIRAHRVELLKVFSDNPVLVGTYWFATEASAPWLHALVRYESAGGDLTLRLRSLERTAYWAR